MALLPRNKDRLKIIGSYVARLKRLPAIATDAMSLTSPDLFRMGINF
jgi:hypothetical protein